jgi:5-methylcytosine-specific restriction endonuclease McrA
MSAGHPFSTRRGRRLRQAKLRSVDHLCERCRSLGVLVEAMTVDHIVALEDGGEPYPPLEGLTAYCSDCHKHRHGARPKVKIDPATGLPEAGQDHWWSEK